MEDPIKIFAEWYKEAQKLGLLEPTAMSLATAAKDGKPSVRMVLLKKFGVDGFTFFTHYTSRKGKELLENPNAALCFYWAAIKKQVRIEGPVEKIADDEAELYFHSRHPESQVGALASNQSEPLKDRAILLNRIAELKAEYQDGVIPRPPHWSGFRVKPLAIEFWEEGEFRVHNRVLYHKTEDGWEKGLLYP